MTVLCVLLAIAFAGLLLSRIHFHFSFNLTISRRGATEQMPMRSRAKIRRNAAGATPTAPAVQSIRPSQDEADLVSALLNLGCEKGKASKVAKAAMGQGLTFDDRVKWAVQNAA